VTHRTAIEGGVGLRTDQCSCQNRRCRIKNKKKKKRGGGERRGQEAPSFQKTLSRTRKRKIQRAGLGKKMYDQPWENVQKEGEKERKK